MPQVTIQEEITRLLQRRAEYLVHLDALLAAEELGVDPALVPRLQSDITTTYNFIAEVDRRLQLLREGVPPEEIPPIPEPPEEGPERPGGLLAPVYSFLQDMWDGLTSTLGGQLQDTRTRILGSIRPISGLASATWDLLNDPASQLYRRIDQALGDVLPDDLVEVGAGIAGIRDQVIDLAFEEIPRAISGAQEGIASFLGQGMDAFFRGSGELIGTVLGGAATAFLEALEKSFPLIGGGLFKMIRDLPDLPEEVRPLFAEAAEPSSQIGALLGQSATQAAIGGTVGNAMGTLLAPVTFSLNRLWRYTHFDVSTAVRGLYRQPANRDFFRDELADLGWADGRQDTLIEVSRPRPGPGDLRTLVNRQPIMEEEALDELQHQGYREIDARRLLSLRRVLPGPSDIIRFAVREAFREDIVRDFQLDSDFPTDAVPLAERVGLAADDFKLNWRAHWELPSITQAFEMYHRTTTDPIPGWSDSVTLPSGAIVHRIISLARLEELLRVQDVMAPWRDPITRVAFTPFTRVDIRRLFRTGVFDLDAVVRAYLDIGYSEANARIQADFVIGLEVEQTFNDVETVVRGQARAGVLSIESAIDTLASVVDPQSGIKPPGRVLDRAADRIRIQVQGDRRNDLVSAWRSALRLNRTTVAAFRAALDQVGILPGVIDHLVAVETVRRGEDSAADEEVQARAAGRGSVVRRYREGLTDEDGFQLEMASLGYSELETARYLEIARLEFDTNWRLDLVQVSLTAFRKGRITMDALGDRLDELGIAPDLRDAYLERELSRIRVEDLDADEVELRATGSGVVIRRYREGWSNPPQFAAEMAALGYADRETQRYQLIADLEFDYDWKQDILGLYRKAFDEGKIDALRFTDDLIAWGMDPSRVQTHLAKLAIAEGLKAPTPLTP